jgi:hypothetical protein
MQGGIIEPDLAPSLNDLQIRKVFKPKMPSKKSPINFVLKVHWGYKN